MSARILPLLVLSACYGTAAAPPGPPPPPAPPPAPPAPLESYALHPVRGLVKLDLANERMQPLFPVDDVRLFLSRSAGVIDGRFYTCFPDGSGDGQLASIDLTTGELDHSRHHCVALTTYGRQLWILSGHGAYPDLEEFRNPATLRSGSGPNRELTVKLAGATAIAATASHLIVASNRDGELAMIAMIDRTTTELKRLPIRLGDARIGGLAATRTRLYVAGDQGIAVFELATGRRLRTLFPGESFSGLTAPRAPATAARP